MKVRYLEVIEKNIDRFNCIKIKNFNMVNGIIINVKK